MDKQYCTFKVGGNYFGIPVLEVQEVIRPMPSTRVPLAKSQIKGLINLRGQIVTLVGLRELFEFDSVSNEKSMNVVIRSDDSLLALVVDEINDVIDVPENSFEKAPATLDKGLKQYVKGIHKLQGQLLIVLDLNKVINF